MSDSEIIDRLGGTVTVARIFGVFPQAISNWRSKGIPPARRMYLKLAHPEAFEDRPKQARVRKPAKSSS